MVSYFCLLLGMLVAKWEPTPCYRDAYPVDIPEWACWGERLANPLSDHVFPLVWSFLLGQQKNFSFFLEGSYCILGLAPGFFPQVSCPLSLSM